MGTQWPREIKRLPMTSQLVDGTAGMPCHLHPASAQQRPLVTNAKADSDENDKLLIDR